MFNGVRYITAGVAAKIPTEIQLIMWQMVDKMQHSENFTLDYLQELDLKSILIDDHVFLEITHRQEVEPYSKTVLARFSQLFNTKIFVVRAINEDGYEYSVMMLSKEY